MKTLLELRTHVRKLVDEEDPTFFDNDELDVYLNNSYNVLCQAIRNTRGDYYEKTTDGSSHLSVSADGQEIDLPSDYAGTIKALVDITSDPYVPLEFHPLKYSLIAISSNSSGPPRYYSILGHRKIRLDRKSDGSYTLQLTYEYLPADLSGDSSQVDFPIGYESLIAEDTVLYCAFKTYVPRPLFIQKHEMRKDEMLRNLRNPKQTFTTRRIRRI